MRNGDMKGRNARSALARRLFKGIGSALAAMLAAWAVGSTAATLTINGQQVTLEGDASATITHTSNGIDIEIPGVSIELDCTTQGATTDECVVKIGAGSTASSGGISSGSGGVSTGSGDTSAGSDSGGISSGSGGVSTGSGDTNAGSDSGSISSGSGGVSTGSGDTSAGSDSDAVSSGSDDPVGSSTGSSIGGGTSGINTSGSDACDSGSGNSLSFAQSTCSYFDDDSDNTDPSDTTDGAADDAGDTGSTGGTIGGNRTGGTGSDGGTSSDDSKSIGGSTGIDTSSGDGGSTAGVVPFPTGSGTGCANGRASCSGGELGPSVVEQTELTVAKGIVTVASFTLGADNIDGFIGWVPASTYPRPSGVLRVWISRAPDGDRLSAACGYPVGPEERMLITTKASFNACVLDPSEKQYYVNFAICDSGSEDYSCRAPEAKTGSGDFSYYVQPVF